ncbi:MAG: GTP-binding signal recognition particle G-domain FlhF, partial [Pseudomonadota bacterium]
MSQSNTAMNVRRFTAKTAREALAQVRQALGEDAVVLSTRPCDGGVEVLAMAPEGLQQAEAVAARALPPPSAPPAPSAAAAAPAAPGGVLGRAMSLAERIAARGEHRLGQGPAGGERHEPGFGAQEPHVAGQAALSARPPAGGDTAIDPQVARDIETLGMSTLTFQDYVRERMLRRRQAELEQQAPTRLPQAMGLEPAAAVPPGVTGHAAQASQTAKVSHPAPPIAAHGPAAGHPAAAAPTGAAAPASGTLRLPGKAAQRPAAATGTPTLRVIANPQPPQAGAEAEAPVLRAELGQGAPAFSDDDFDATPAPGRGSRVEDLLDRQEVMGELRQVRHLIEERFGMLAYMERLQRDPRQVALLQRLFDCGLSPGLVRKLVQALPADVPDDLAWAAGVLERNLPSGEHEAPLEDHAGVLAFVGPTGVGKTTGTAKLAAAFAARHGAANLGLITLDAYRVGAHEQLRAYGRILGVPVHTAHDRTALEDLLDLLSAKKMVLIDTAGLAQRDTRTRELLDMLAHRSINRLLVVNAASQGETIEDVLMAYR